MLFLRLFFTTNIITYFLAWFVTKNHNEYFKSIEKASVYVMEYRRIIPSKSNGLFIGIVEMHFKELLSSKNDDSFEIGRNDDNTPGL